MENVASIDPALLANIPALPPPPGVVPNFMNPPTRAHQTQVVSAICLSLMCPLVALRVYCRLVVQHNWGIDDCMFACSSVATTATSLWS
jgi:hypothetical protein